MRKMPSPTGKRISILYDHQIFSLQSIGGISAYFQTIIEATHTHDILKSEIWTRMSGNEWIRRHISVFFVPRTWTRVRGVFACIYAYNKLRTRRSVWTKKTPKLIHHTLYDPFLLKKYPKIQHILTVHDLIHKAHPEFERKNKIGLFDFADQGIQSFLEHKNVHCICVSEFTKNELMKYYTLPFANNIHVIHHGVDIDTIRQYVSQTGELKDKKPYIVMIGLRGRYKNVWPCIQALAPQLKKNDRNLILIGGGELNEEEHNILKNLELQDRVRQTYASEQEKFQLLAHAVAFVYPSLYEGFGIPLIEALAVHCPVICSDIPVFREVGGKACEYIDTTDRQARTDALRSAQEKKNNDNRRHRVDDHMKQFVAQRMVEKTQHLYLQALGIHA